MIPALARAATARLIEGEGGERVVEVIWTTGATIQRRRWEGWDEIVEFDEELVVEPGAIRLERMQGGAPFLDTHNGFSLRSVLGSVVPGSVRIEGGKGLARVRLTDAPDAAPAIQRVLEKHVAISVGYRVHRFEITKRDGQREHWRAVDWEPLEISAVPMPADPGAHIRAGESRAGALAPCVLVPRDASTAARAAISKEAAMPEDQTAAVAEQRAAETTTPAPAAQGQAAPAPAAAPADAAAIRAAERQTARDILALCARHGFGQDFAADLIGRGVGLDAARAAILDKLADSDDRTGARSEPAPARARSDGSADRAFGDAMAAALLHRHDPGRHTLAAGARDFRGHSLLDLARMSLERRGVSTAGMGRMEIAGMALNTRAGLHSTSDFPFILANVANKTLRAAYEGTPRTFVAWARQATITDFKQVSRVQLGGAPNLQLVPESGEFSYGTIGEGREVYALLTYGRIVGVTRQAIVNDDLDAFTRVPAAFGAAAADLESDIVYSILTGNPNMSDGVALFHATHGNLGTAGAINETSLAEAYRLFGAQRGLEGRQISVLPRFIITPPGARGVEARKNVTATTPNAVAGVNAFANRLEVVEEARLLPPSGADPWFLAADPARIDTVEYAYLEGQQGVATEVRQGFEVDGIEIKARHDFAAKAIDWRGLFRNAGA
jgi:hypothetical protein